MTNSSRIFVAGGTGMVGSAIIGKLLSSGYTNIASNYHRRKPSELVGPFPRFLASSLPSIRWSQLDLRRQSDTEAFFETERPEYVFLAAAKVGGILANSTYKADFIYDNLAIATNVISCSHKYGVAKLLNLGSSCIYPRLAPQPMKEEYLLTGPPEPTNEPYAIAKIAAIKLCRYFNEQHGTNFISVMPTNLYGPNDNFNLETSHVLPALMRKFHLAKLLNDGDFTGLRNDIEGHGLGFGLDKAVNPTDKRSIENILLQLGISADRVILWGTGEVYREFLYVDDLAEAAVFVMENCNNEDTGEFINLGSGKDVSLKNLALLVKDTSGFSGGIQYDPSKPDGMPKKLLDVSRMTRLGWHASTSLENGIKQTYKAYSSL
jgi:GDP-L-fucose synthase